LRKHCKGDRMIITLLSDFQDFYPASMKGVILRINPDAKIIDISHNIPKHNVFAGAFVLMTTVKYFPSRSVHIAVVDPGVGTERRGIGIMSHSKSLGFHVFIGPDNGLLIPASKSIGEFEVYELTNKNLFQKNVSDSFHGRDIFASVGAYISTGISLSDVGRQIFDYVKLDFGKAKITENLIIGKVIFIDSFGNIITNIKLENVKIGKTYEIDGKKLVFQKSYGFCDKGEPLILIGSHGYLEIAVNNGNASEFFNKKQGDDIVLNFV